MSTTPARVPAALDPLAVLKGFASLRKLTGSYPAGHPTISQKLAELDDAIGGHLRTHRELRIDVIHGGVYLDDVSHTKDAPGHASIINELGDLGVDSIQIREGVQRDELLALAECLWRCERSATET